MKKDDGRTETGRAVSEGKKSALDELMRNTMDQVKAMVDTNTIVGTPITTPDGVTLIPISRVSFGFGSGGGNYGKNVRDGFAGGGAAGVRIDPVAFLTVKDGFTRVLPVTAAPSNTVDRIVDMAPDIVSKVENFISRGREPEEA